MGIKRSGTQAAIVADPLTGRRKQSSRPACCNSSQAWLHTARAGFFLFRAGRPAAQEGKIPGQRTVRGFFLESVLKFVKGTAKTFPKILLEEIPAWVIIKLESAGTFFGNESRFT